MRIVAPRCAGIARRRARMGGRRAKSAATSSNGRSSASGGADGAGPHSNSPRAASIAALPSQAVILTLRSPADAKLPTPPERAPKEGTFAGFASITKAPKAGLYTDQPVRGRLGRRRAGRPFPQAQGVQRRHRLRRHPQDHEVRALGEPVRAAGQRNEGGFHLDRDHADGIATSAETKGHFTRTASLLLSAHSRYSDRP